MFPGHASVSDVNQGRYFPHSPIHTKPRCLATLWSFMVVVFIFHGLDLALLRFTWVAGFSGYHGHLSAKRFLVWALPSKGWVFSVCVASGYSHRTGKTCMLITGERQITCSTCLKKKQVLYENMIWSRGAFSKTRKSLDKYHYTHRQQNQSWTCYRFLLQS